MNFKKFKSLDNKDVYINCDLIEAIAPHAYDDEKTCVKIFVTGSNDPYIVAENLDYVLYKVGCINV